MQQTNYGSGVRMAQNSEIVRKFEGMGVDEVPMSIPVKVEGREGRARKIVAKHIKVNKSNEGASYDKFTPPIVHTEVLLNGELVYKVLSPTTKAWYTVTGGKEWTCTCPDHQFHTNEECKHIMAVKICIEENIKIIDKTDIMQMLEDIEQ